MSFAKYHVNFLIISGWYWIDPNLGVSTDAVQAFCHFSDGPVKTCIHPLPHTDRVRTLSGQFEGDIFTIVFSVAGQAERVAEGARVQVVQRHGQWLPGDIF